MTIDPYAELTYGVLDDGPIDFESNPAIAALSESIENDRGKTYPPQVRALALNLWTFDAARNSRRVAELLKERAGIEVSDQTIRNWSHADQWEERAGQLHQSFAVSLASTVEASVSRASVEAISTLRDIMANSESDGSRVKAAMYVLGVAGYVPQMPSNNINLAVNMGRGALAEATDEELHQRALEYRPDDPDVESPTIEATWSEQRIAQQQHHNAHMNHARHNT